MSLTSVQRFTQILFLKSIRPIEIMTSLLSTIITFDSIIFVCLMVLFLNEVRKLTTLDAYGGSRLVTIKRRTCEGTASIIWSRNFLFMRSDRTSLSANIVTDFLLCVTAQIIRRSTFSGSIKTSKCLSLSGVGVFLL